jgi:hypothetical protein
MLQHLVNSESLGPKPLSVSTEARVISTIVGICCIAVLGVAAWLTPNQHGVGTHCELGFNGCLWVQRIDMPCPTCGMTTAFAHAANGHLWKAFLTQPLGAILAVATAMTFWICLYVAATGSRVGSLLIGLWHSSLLWIIGGLAVVAWIYKIWAFKNGFA